MKRSLIPDPSVWGLTVDADNLLCLGTHTLQSLAAEYGTPLHVVDGDRLIASARRLVTTAREAYPGTASLHFAMKCNGVPGIVSMVRRAGFRVEVMSPLELSTARLAGYAGREIIVNGPGKKEEFLRECLREHVRFIVVDSLEEIDRLATLARNASTTVDVLLRVNPDIVPSGMNAGSATGSRTGCAFGLDLKGGEVHPAMKRVLECDTLRLSGFHLHIGTGIRTPSDYLPAVRVLADLFREAFRIGGTPTVLDVGGGFASPASREFTSNEMLMYQAFGRLPRLGSLSPAPDVFIRSIAAAVKQLFTGDRLPELIFEPGRAITGPYQLMLLSVLAVKHRPGVGTWLITDGGLGTVSMPTYYEVHEVFPCSGPLRRRTETVTILGPGCFAGDIVYRSKQLPPVNAGDVLTLMDTGAYFTALESNFGHLRPAIVSIEDGSVHEIRRRETFEEAVGRDTVLPALHEVLP
jgi:diaminopimelate decarboxylase